MTARSPTLERYALRLRDSGPFLAIEGHDQHLSEVPSPEQAYHFHSHQGALLRARDLARVVGRGIDVVKLR
ncbi:MAG: hypothetical protein VKO00_02170 [Cyanobacteriota bacterium]|nr:hypothetical protein [Cyanobacteriota bacterium]